MSDNTSKRVVTCKDEIIATPQLKHDTDKVWSIYTVY